MLEGSKAVQYLKISKKLLLARFTPELSNAKERLKPRKTEAVRVAFLITHGVRNIAYFVE